MEHWPADERQPAYPVKKRGRGKKTLQVHDTQYWNHPVLNYATFGGATLVPSNGRLAWTTVVDTSNALSVTPVAQGHCIFPATRPINPTPSRLTQWKRIEEGLNFVRSCFPDADFPTDLVKAEFQVDERQNRDLQVYDFLRGSLLSIAPYSSIPQTSAVLFPMGENSSQLNVSFITDNKSNSSTFHPSGHAAFKFETPICQILSPDASKLPPKHGKSVLVRTFSATSLLSIESLDDGTDVKATREVDILSDDTGGQSVVDVVFSSHHSDIIAVSSSGVVYNCTIYPGGKSVRQIGLNHVHFENPNEDKFWRLRPSDQGCFLASSSFVKHFDFRTGEPAVNLFSTHQLGPVVTSFDQLEREHLISLSTTSELIWLDDRYTKKTLLSLKHNRAHDRSLNVQTARLDTGPLTFLSSLRNGLITIYDVSRGFDHLTHCNSVPTYLPQDGDMSARDSESGFFVQSNKSTFSLLKLSSQGSLHCQDFIVCRSDMDVALRPTTGTSHEWSADVQKLADKAQELQPQYGPLSARHFSELNLHTAYQKIFFVGGVTERIAPEDNLVEVINKLSQFWQREEDTDKIMLTLCDICLRVEEGPNEASRADFFTGGVINSNDGYRSLVCDQLPIQNIASGAAWHWDFESFLGRVGLGHVNKCGRLEAFSLSYPVDAPEQFVRQEEESQEQLILDLALSSMVFSSQHVSMPDAPNQLGDVETMSLAAKGLTLNDEPPEIQLGYLRPCRKLGINHYANTVKDKDVVAEPAKCVDFSTPMGVRLLLREWEVGTDVESYVYCDPYNTEDDEHVSDPSQERTLPTDPGGAQFTFRLSQHPPPVATSFAPCPPAIYVARNHWERFGTQPQDFTLQATNIQNGNYPEASQPCQELMTSTQVLPGPHGGRPAPSNRRPVKKRRVGF